MSDIITHLIDAFREQLGDLHPDVYRGIERRARQRFGGEAAYIAKSGVTTETKKQTIRNELRAGLSIAQIEEQHGIPRRTIYRLINNKPRG
ncbi:MAG: hypothetical protein PHY92_10815 [Alphaproteobacteria bacterium]|nr:hypothetical protein [Alphaproteobacteria bacterium]